MSSLSRDTFLGDSFDVKKGRDGREVEAAAGEGRRGGGEGVRKEGRGGRSVALSYPRSHAWLPPPLCRLGSLSSAFLGG